MIVFRSDIELMSSSTLEVLAILPSLLCTETFIRKFSDHSASIFFSDKL